MAAIEIAAVDTMMDASLIQLLRRQAEICKTLAHPKRLMIIHELREGEMSVGHMVSRLGLSQANVSQHLAILRDRGIVAPRREGTTVYYSLASPKIGQACDLVQEVLAEQLSQTQALVNSLGPPGRET
jgi:DNA-binding transcriptional ArsR family regulator